ncbi:MAG: DMP19 family protein [Bacteroidaceae bacterium]|nr:DMP19 family protein [Bacteroidaceae bacterium]MBR3444053.1 DMP19 family protein [Bacteroidaceae bacterium]
MNTPLDTAWNEGPEAYIRTLTDAYLERIGGELTPETIGLLTADQLTLLAYRYLLDEVMQGGFIQLIQNGLGPFVLDGPFAMMMKKHWGLRDFGNFIYDVQHEYHRHRDELEADLDEEQFMALYEQQEAMNELGDDFLDDYQESVTPAIAQYVRDHESQFLLP